MSNDKLISVIIPVYNVERYLKRCLDSVTNQTYKNLEIILINDGSTDSSGSICNEYAKKDNRIITIHKKNGGVSSARNKGIEIAKGEYIGFIDSDDYVESNMYQELYNEAIRSDADIVMTNYTVKTEKYEKKHFINKERDVLSKEEFYDKLLDNYFQGYLTTKLFNRRIIFATNKIILLNEKVHIYEDLLFLVNVAKNGSKFVFINRYLYNYCIRGNSAYNNYISSYNSKQLSILDAMDEMLRVVEKEASMISIKYKKAYMEVALQLFEQYCMFDKAQENDEKYIKDCVNRYYKEVLENKNISLKQKIVIMIHFNFPKLFRNLKEIYHKFKY